MLYVYVVFRYLAALIWLLKRREEEKNVIYCKTVLPPSTLFATVNDMHGVTKASTFMRPIHARSYLECFVIIARLDILSPLFFSSTGKSLSVR